MEQNFQTSFIPKKPMMAEERSVSTKKPIGLLTLISIFIFLAIVLATGILYFYENILNNNIQTKEKELTLAKERFEPAKINQLQVLGKRLEAANLILAKHVAISPIFESLQKITMKTIRYTKFNYELGNDQDSKIKVKVSGQAIGYRSIALQSELLTKDKNFIEPVFSNLSLDEKGNVIFDLEFFVNPNFVNYKKVFSEEAQKNENISPINTNQLIN
jgi:hypothetical protein